MNMNETKRKMMEIIRKTGYDEIYAHKILNAQDDKRLQEIASEITSVATEKASIHGLTRRGEHLVTMFKMAEFLLKLQPAKQEAKVHHPEPSAFANVRPMNLPPEIIAIRHAID